MIYKLKENGNQWHRNPKSTTYDFRYMAYMAHRCWIGLCKEYFLLSERTTEFLTFSGLDSGFLWWLCNRQHWETFKKHFQTTLFICHQVIRADGYTDTIGWVWLCWRQYVCETYLKLNKVLEVSTFWSLFRCTMQFAQCPALGRHGIPDLQTSLYDSVDGVTVFERNGCDREMTTI